MPFLSSRPVKFPELDIVAVVEVASVIVDDIVTVVGASDDIEAVLKRRCTQGHGQQHNKADCFFHDIFLLRLLCKDNKKDKIKNKRDAG